MAKRFAVAIRDFGKRASQNVSAVVRWTALHMHRRVILRSPVGNPSLWKHVIEGGKAPPGYVGGRFRGNWQVSIGAPKSEMLNRTDAARATGEAALELATWRGEGTAFITNNLPYSERLERGWSSQAPRGIMRTTIREFKHIVKQQADTARRRG